MVDEMKKALDSGENILVDRYAYSGVAFSAAKVMYLLVVGNPFIPDLTKQI